MIRTARTWKFDGYALNKESGALEKVTFSVNEYNKEKAIAKVRKQENVIVDVASAQAIDTTYEMSDEFFFEHAIKVAQKIVTDEKEN